MMRYFIVVMSIILLIGTGLYAGSDGGSLDAFLRLGIGAKASSLGKSFVARADDVSAIYWNNAGLTQLEKTHFGAMFSKPFSDFGDINYNFIGISRPLKMDSVISGGIVYLNVGDILRISAVSDDTGTYSDKQAALMFGYSKKISQTLSAGINLKYVTHTLADNKGNLFSLDISSLKVINDALQFGLVIRNVFCTEMKLGSTKEKFPVTMSFGIKFELLRSFSVSTDINWQERRDWKVSAGIEYNPLKKLSLRMGYDGDGSQFLGGLGFEVSEIFFDYGFNTNTNLGDSHRFSIGTAF